MSYVKYIGPPKKVKKGWCRFFDVYLFQGLHKFVDIEEDNPAYGWVMVCKRCGKEISCR